MTTNEINRIVAGFKEHTLPKEEWTHKNHVLVASWYLLNYSLEETKELLREAIKLYNKATGGQNTDTDGYHETITMFWIYKIRAFLEKEVKTESVETVINKVLDGDFLKTNYPLSYYSQELLMSVEARRNWVEPDLKKLEVNDTF